MKYPSLALGLTVLAGLIGGCSGGSLGGGSRLLITRGENFNQKIYLLSSTGGTIQQLTPDAQSDETPRWSPDGTRIAFIRQDRDSGLSALYLMNENGSNPQNLISNVLEADDLLSEPAWLSNEALVYRRGTESSDGLVKRIISTGEVTTLTTPGTDKVDSYPAVSPDGTKLAFIRTTKVGMTSNSALFLANADGTEARSVVSLAAQSAPAWSPDGTRLAFVYSGNGNQEIYLAAADGTNVQRLTNNAAKDFAPIWSPDSSKLIFASDRDGNNELYRINLDGSGLLRLTNNTVLDIPYGWR